MACTSIKHTGYTFLFSTPWEYGLHPNMNRYGEK